MLRAFLLWTAAVLLVLALAWMGAALYVQRSAARDVAALRASVDPATPDKPDFARAFARVKAQGCRALPALMADLRKDLDPFYVELLGYLVLDATLGRRADGEVTPLNRRAFTEEEFERGIDVIRAWWARKGQGYHQPWRFWSTSCR